MNSSAGQGASAGQSASAARRMDRVDAEQFEQMVLSPSWARYAARVEAEYQRVVALCTRADGVAELRRAQGAVVALRAVLETPAAILAAMKNPK